MFFDKNPNFQHLRVLGCLCYATITKDCSDKFGPRAEKAVHLGYSSTQKGYVLYSLSHKHFFVSRDVIFHENIFPFLVTPPSSFLFPNEVVAHDDVGDDLDCPVPTPVAKPISIQPSPTIRHSSREVKPPSWLQDFVHAPLPSHNVSSSSCQYPLSTLYVLCQYCYPSLSLHMCLLFHQRAYILC